MTLDLDLGPTPHQSFIERWMETIGELRTNARTVFTPGRPVSFVVSRDACPSCGNEALVAVTGTVDESTDDDPGYGEIVVYDEDGVRVAIQPWLGPECYALRHQHLVRVLLTAARDRLDALTA